MLKQGNDYTRDREKALADGLRDVACELRMIDPADFIAFIRTDQFGNLRNLVNSSTEMFFKPGTISFGLSGEADIRWDCEPQVSLDMEFHHMRVSVYFRLVLQAMHAGVEIDYLQFDGGAVDPDENTRRLVAAIADARLVPVKRGNREALATSA
ncbi:MAG: hypothetical protein WC807_07640 [Hyphomicrobium sp.]|jgi:hypothetical protein